MLVITAALVAALHSAPGHIQAGAPGARQSRPPETDETVAVTRGARLSLDNFAGEVFVRGWDRDSVRVQARHASRTRVTVRPTRSNVVITASGSQGPAGTVDYDISVPSWMAVKIEGTYVYIAVEGTQAEVAAETVRGDISIKGGTGFVSAKSVEGEVQLDGVRGRITAHSVNQGITITGATGQVIAETINGPIALTGIDADNVDVSAVNGHLKFEGTTAAHGKYRFSTHNGNISVAVPESGSATFTVRTYNGTVATNLPLQGGKETGRGRRSIYTLGSGSAEFELESFGGTIQLRKRGTDLPAGRGKDTEK